MSLEDLAEKVPLGEITLSRREQVEKSWGWEDIYVINGFCLKKLHIYDGQSTSFHYHKERDEVLIVEEGTAIVIIEGDDKELKKAAIPTRWIVRIKKGVAHKIQAARTGDPNRMAIVMECSSSNDNSDIYRLEEK